MKEKVLQEAPRGYYSQTSICIKKFELDENSEHSYNDTHAPKCKYYCLRIVNKIQWTKKNENNGHVHI